MRILEELYRGWGNLRESAWRSSALREKLRVLVATSDQRMLAMLTDAQKEQAERCWDSAGELSDLMEREAFANDFCLAMKILMVDCSLLYHSGF